MKYYLFHNPSNYTFICECVSSDECTVVVRVKSIPWHNTQSWYRSFLDNYVKDRTFSLSKNVNFKSFPVTGWVLGSHYVCASNDYEQILSEAALLQL